jgi:hypothetical protein
MEFPIIICKIRKYFGVEETMSPKGRSENGEVIFSKICRLNHNFLKF